MGFAGGSGGRRPPRAVGDLQRNFRRQITVQWTGNSERNRYFPEEVSTRVKENA